MDSRWVRGLEFRWSKWGSCIVARAPLMQKKDSTSLNMFIGDWDNVFNMHCLPIPMYIYYILPQSPLLKKLLSWPFHLPVLINFIKRFLSGGGGVFALTTLH